MKQLVSKFWAWYERHYLLNLSISTFLFLFQAFHLYWLFADVILKKLTGQSYFIFPPIWGSVSTLLDYTEIPALIGTSLVYLNLLRHQFSYKNLWFLLALNIQWLHLFWITDEVVVERFGISQGLFHWSIAMAWIAILIDYLELPVMVDTSRKLYLEIKTKLRNYVY